MKIAAALGVWPFKGQTIIILDGDGLRRLRGIGDKKASLMTSFMLAWTDYFSGLQVNYRKTTEVDGLILIISAMTTDKLQSNYRITSDPFSESFVHPTPYLHDWCSVQRLTATQ